MPKVCLAVPCYNCETQIRRVISSLTPQTLKRVNHLVFIENRSTDGTLEVLKGLLPELKKRLPGIDVSILSHKENYGLGGSFKTATQFCKENSLKTLLWFHGDDQARITDLPAVLDELETGVDCVFGSRFIRGAQRFNYSFQRTLGNQALNGIYSALLKQKIHELGSGLNAYRISALPEDIEAWPNHIAFDANLLFHFTEKDNFSWVPIEWHEKDQVSNARNFRVAFDLLKMLLGYKLTGLLDTKKEFRLQRGHTLYA